MASSYYISLTIFQALLQTKSYKYSTAMSKAKKSTFSSPYNGRAVLKGSTYTRGGAERGNSLSTRANNSNNARNRAGGNRHRVACVRTCPKSRDMLETRWWYLAGTEKNFAGWIRDAWHGTEVHRLFFYEDVHYLRSSTPHPKAGLERTEWATR